MDVICSIPAPCHAELVSTSPGLSVRFRNKFGMTLAKERP
jgi:hypothetical protein